MSSFCCTKNDECKHNFSAILMLFRKFTNLNAMLFSEKCLILQWIGLKWKENFNFSHWNWSEIQFYTQFTALTLLHFTVKFFSKKFLLVEMIPIFCEIRGQVKQKPKWVLKNLLSLTTTFTRNSIYFLLKIVVSTRLKFNFWFENDCFLLNLIDWNIIK